MYGCFTQAYTWRDLYELQPARVQVLAGADESLTSALRKIAGAAIAEKLIRFFQAAC
jgi:hypothetical protein